MDFSDASHVSQRISVCCIRVMGRILHYCAKHASIQTLLLLLMLLPAHATLSHAQTI